MATYERGRPTEYDPKYCDEILEYFSIEPYREIEKKILTKSGDVVVVTEDKSNDFPSFSGFACKIGVHRSTMHLWIKTYPDFKEAYLLAKEYQEKFLLVNGLKTLIHPGFGMFTLKNACGYRDKNSEEAKEERDAAKEDAKEVAVFELRERIKLLKDNS